MANPSLEDSITAEHPHVERHDVEAVNAASRRDLYKAREQIYPKLVHGFYRRLKWLVLFATLGVYYFIPWIRWARGPGEPNQAVLVDFPGRRFYFFFIEIWPDELYYLTGLLIVAALSLFLATALFGRVWCGYACPQTVWTDLFVAVERFVEGDRNKRIKLDKAPWSAEKVARKAIKHILWLAIAAATGGAWVFYFHDAPTIFPQLFRGEAPFSAYLFMGLLTATTYIFAGSMREQICTYMCPWPRIQAALVDAETLQVTYKYDRGEPRGSHKKGESWVGRGDCVDCNACVAACPMGIDIREGAQLECINCALCIDACDDIMKKVGRPIRLIGYDTDKNIVRRQAGERPQVKLIRKRTILYATLLAAVSAIMMWSLSTRATLELNIIRDRTPPYVVLSDGSVRNAYTLKIVNKATLGRPLEVEISGDRDFTVSAVGETFEDKRATISVTGDDVRALRVFVTMPLAENTHPTFPLKVIVRDPASGETATSPTTFLTERRR